MAKRKRSKKRPAKKKSRSSRKRSSRSTSRRRKRSSRSTSRRRKPSRKAGSRPPARTPRGTPAQRRKVGRVMGEFKRGKLTSHPTGKTVTSRKQAIAIALSEAGLSRPKKRKRRTSRRKRR